MKLTTIIAGLLILLPAGCSTGPEVAAVAETVPVYRLAPDDRIKVSVFGEAEMTGEYNVGSDGAISFPLIGDVKVGGLTLEQFRAALTKRLAARYIKDPRVSADLVSYRPFYILGEVNRPGQYPYRVGMTVNAAVATAGGFTYRANKSTVAIQHSGNPDEIRYKLGSNLPVQAGDTVRVLERFF